MNFLPSFVVDKRRFYSQNFTNLFVVLPNKGARGRVNSNYIQLVLIGLCLGVTLGIAVIPLLDSFECQNTSMKLPETELIANPVILEHSERPNENKKLTEDISLKTLKDQAQSMKIRRPRFYSTELGLRNKLIVGIVLTDYTKIDNLVAINRTLSPFVGQILFFVVGQSVAKKVKHLGLANVVTLPETVALKGVEKNKLGESIRLRLDKSMYNRAALKTIKYFGGKLAYSYDYFFIGLDVAYINGRNLINAVKRISIKEDVLWGVTEESGCSLEKGMVLSRSLIRKLSSRIERCFHNYSLPMSKNLTKCFQYALGSTECSNLVQDQRYLSISAGSLDELCNAISIGPVSSPEELFQLHAKIAHTRKIEIGQEIKQAEMIIDQMAPSIPIGFDISSWPKGLPLPHRPMTRFDVLKWKYFTLSAIYPKNEHITEAFLNGIDEIDIRAVVNDSISYLRNVLHQNEDFSPTLLNGYTRFDEIRGMEYLLDFLDGDGQIHRIECLRPLSNIEVLPVPFVTENRRLTIIVPVELDQYNLTDKFLKSYMDNAVDKKSNSVLLLAIIVNESSIVGRRANQLNSIKQLVSKHNIQFANQSKRDNRTTNSENLQIGYVVVNMRQLKTSNFAIAVFDNLAGRIISPNSLVLIMDSFVTLKDEFLNRVKMNTISNYQIFSPMPFVEYNYHISGHRYDDNGLEIHKTTGYFDTNNFGFVSFFVADYIAVRKRVNISVLMEAESKHTGVSILPILFEQVSQVYVLRAPEPNLKVRFTKNAFQNCPNEECLKRQWASKTKLGNFVLQSMNEIV